MLVLLLGGARRIGHLDIAFGVVLVQLGFLRLPPLGLPVSLPVGAVHEQPLVFENIAKET